MNAGILRLYIRALLREEKITLGEPDTTAEKKRDEPQPQYEDEESGEDKDADEASTIAGMGAGLGPAMPLEYDPENPVLDPYEKNKKKKKNS